MLAQQGGSGSRNDHETSLKALTRPPSCARPPDVEVKTTAALPALASCRKARDKASCTFFIVRRGALEAVATRIPRSTAKNAVQLSRITSGGLSGRRCAASNTALVSARNAASS